MADLKTNYVDDVLDTTKNQLRKYKQIQNDDGTVSFVDVTEYTQVGTSFGAKDINDTNAAINDVNGKLANYGNDKKMGKLLSIYDNYILDMFKKASISFSPTFGQLDVGGPIVAYIMQKHSDYYGGAVITFGYHNFRPVYYHIVNGTIDAEYYL